MRRPFVRGLAAAAAWAAMSGAEASVSTGIAVTDFRVDVASLAPGAAPAVSFAGAVGSSAESDCSTATSPAVDRQAFASGRPFGTVQASTSESPFASGAASFSGDVFGAGATIQTSASASSLASRSLGEATIGLVDDVSTASFALAPWTVMTISANVRAWASSTGAIPFEQADSGVLMAIGDSEGTGPQFGDVSFDAFAFGALGAVDDTESFAIVMSYENASDATIFGLFSGYVASYASSDSPVSTVSEPGSKAMLLAGLLTVTATARAFGVQAGTRRGRSRGP